MIIGYRGIGKTVKFRKPIHILPHLAVICMENVRPVFVHLDSLYLLCVNISRDMRPLVNHKNGFSPIFGLSGKHGAIESCADN